MLFNSAEFIFAFLPLTLLGFAALGWRSRDAALGWIIAASIFFYAWWRPLNVLIIAPSILVNYFVARALLRQAVSGEGNLRSRRLLLGAGIAFNVLFLGYFKYANFATTVVNDVAGTRFVLEQIVLPLGISFITFQKIAFLVDVYGGRVKSFSLRDYCLFVLFFPQLIAGPIVHYREMMPQFQQVSSRLRRENLSVGLTLFVFGLVKKAVFADGIAAHVTPIYVGAANGAHVDLIMGWLAALGFTMQIYFDFSGYTDMALGIARAFGIRLPPNFDSPLKSRSIVEFWLRWHMTLTRFLTAYLYNPIVLQLTRRRLAKGLPGITGRSASPGAFLQLLAGPTLFTMFISGVWHGAGYTFVLWGLLHGTYLVINHAWRTIAPKLWRRRESYERIMGPVGFLLTFLGVSMSMVLFRAPTLGAAKQILKGVFGLNGLALPQVIFDRLGHVASVLGSHLSPSQMSASDLALAIAWVVGLLFIALVPPNSLEILARVEPALAFKRVAKGLWSRIEWRPSLAWSVGIAAAGILAVTSLGGQSEFLYWQF